MNEMIAERRLEPEAEPPAAKVRRRARLSPVWLVPIVAVIIGGYLAWAAQQDRGPEVKVSFASGEGLEAGRTRIKYKDVDVGTVERVKIRDDRRIVVTARMEPDAAEYMTSGTRFWVVTPQVGAGGITGLGTLVSGAFIEIDPGPGDPQYEFRGLDEAPEIRSDVPGRNFTLRAVTLGAVTRGAPVYYRGIDVGQVLGFDLAEDDSDDVTVSIFVRAPYDQLVHRQTRFWNASGLSIGTGAEGVQVRLASIQSLVLGGIEFETPASAVTSEVASPGTEFVLFEDFDAAQQAAYTRRTMFLVDFEGSARGLQPGAPVEVRGIRVGSVADVRLAYSESASSLLVRTLIGIEPERVQAVNADTGEESPPASVEEMVRRGLRAQLRTGNLLTGELLVDLDFVPGAGDGEMHRIGEYQVIPSVPTQLETIQASATAVLEKFAALPIDELVASLTNTTKAVEAAVASPETEATLASLRTTLIEVGRAVGPLVTSLQGSATAANQTLRQANETLLSVQRTIGPDAPLQADVRGLVRELESAARSVRAFADYLERHPEALLRGKGGSLR